MGSFFSQCFFIPPPPLTEKNLPDQNGKVHLVTGGYSGCGLELTKILYQRNATVYVAGRDPEKASKAISALEMAFPNSCGKLSYLKIDMADLSTIKPAVDEFLSKEKRLDVLTNNAGVMTPPPGSKDAHDHELQIGVNCLGPFLFSKLLMPTLINTAKNSPPESVRVTWAASIVILTAPKNGGVEFDQNGQVKQSYPSNQTDYSVSKTINVYLASEFARRHGKDGIISVSWNPGNLKTELQRHMPNFQAWLLSVLMLHPSVNGAYTELYAGWSRSITSSVNGTFIAPWGRIFPTRDDIEMGMRTRQEGGTGIAVKVWDYCEKQTAAYA